MSELAMPNIPEKCRDCGVQRDAAAIVGRLVELVEEDARFDGDLFRGHDNPLVQRIADIQASMTTNAEACEGTFKMRAPRNGATYTVAVCTSPEAYYSEGESLVSAVVVRHKNSDQ